MAPMFLSLGSGAPTAAKICHGVDVLLHALFVGGLVVVCKDACADLVSEDL